MRSSGAGGQPPRIPNPPGGGIALADLDAARTTPLARPRNPTKADVGWVAIGGARYAVKDYRARPAWIRATVGRWSMAREARAYRALAGVDGVPAFAGRPHPLVLLTALVEGTSLGEWPRERALPEGFFDGLKRLLAELHGRGVVHGDLHHRDVLVGKDGRPWLVDFSTAMAGGPRGNPLRRAAFRLLARLDRQAVLKLQERFRPGTLTAAERLELARPPLVHRLARRLRGRPG
jgi:predicted Ser/Thr protein kinase